MKLGKFKIGKKKKHREEEDEELPLRKRKGSREEDEDEDDDSEDEEDEDDAENSGTPSWMIKGRKQMQNAQRKAEAEHKRNRRPPELWVPPDDSKMVRFLSSEPIGAIFRYGLKINGKWTKVTAPGPGEKDLFKKRGLRASLDAIYPVIDIKGYKDKKTGKAIKEIPRYLIAGSRVEKQLERIREKKGGLTGRDMEYARSGGGTDTVYSFLPEDKSPMPAKYKELGKPLFKEFYNYYAPPSIEEQRLMLSGVSPDDEEDEQPRKSKKREAF